MTEPAISVVIPCYDRIALLSRTLHACFTQRCDAPWEIVVADNHPARLAAPLLAGLSSPVPLRHVAAGERNIARARNRGVAAARGALVAFVDDDEAPEPGWLNAHHDCLRRTGADASFGPKYPVFEGGAAPAWDPDGRFYTTDFGLPADAELRPLDWWPPQARGIGTGNSMLRRATCLPGPAPFDEVFGRSGGEDSMLLLGLSKRGRRFVWCPSATVREFNEAARLHPSYMAARVRRSARHSAAVRVAISERKLLTRLGTGVVGLGQLGVYGALWAATRKPRYGLQMSKGMGKLGFGELEFVPEKAAAM